MTTKAAHSVKVNAAIVAVPKDFETATESTIASINHPLEADVEAVRKAILSVDKSISEGAKWNSLSFRTTEWFATWNWRAKDQTQLVLHLGAKNGKAVEPGAIPRSRGPAGMEGEGQGAGQSGFRSGAEDQASGPESHSQGLDTLRLRPICQWAALG